MKTVTLNTAIKNLPELVKQTIENCEETVIATDDGAVVIVNESEWNNMLEHIHILKDKKAMKALLDAEQMPKDKVTIDPNQRF